MVQLKRLYDSNQKLRPYREDGNGRQFFYFKDKGNGIIVREAMPNLEDAKKIVKVAKNLTPEEILEEIKKVKEEDPNLIFIIETRYKVIAYARTFNSSKNGEEADIEIHYKNPVEQRLFDEMVKDTLQFMCRTTWVYMHLWNSTDTGKVPII